MTEIIKTDGTRQPVQPANGSDFTLKEMQAIVGGYIELVELDGNTSEQDIPCSSPGVERLHRRGRTCVQ